MKRAMKIRYTQDNDYLTSSIRQLKNKKMHV